jgi:hypothetical protein
MPDVVITMTKITHRPDAGNAQCICGSEETYYEAHFDDPTGYGCVASDQPYEGTLDRLGFHIRPQAVLDYMSDDTYDGLTAEELKRLDAWRDRLRRNPHPLDTDSPSYGV